MRRAEGAAAHVGPRGLLGRQGLYLRTDPVLLLQLRQHSRVIGSGVRWTRRGRWRISRGWRSCRQQNDGDEEQEPNRRRPLKQHQSPIEFSYHLNSARKK